MANRTDKYIIELSIDGKKALETLNANKKALVDVRDGFKGLERGSTEYEAQVAKLDAAAREFVKNASPKELDNEYRKLQRELSKLVPGTKDAELAMRQLQVVAEKRKEIKLDISKALGDIKQLEKEANEVDFSNIGESFVSAFNQARAAGDGLFASLGAGFSSIGGALTAAGPLGALLGIGAALVALGSNIVSVTNEFAKYRTEAAQLTQLQGEALNAVVATGKGIAETYGKDFTEVLVAGNALSKQMGISAQEALDLIGKGFDVGADVSGELLEQLKEYPAQFKEAGFSAEEAIAIISQQVKDGVFSDKGVDAIKEFGIKLNTTGDSANQALKNIGLNGDEIMKQLRAGGTTTKEVMDKVVERIQQMPDDSADAKRAISELFGAPGEDSSRKFIESLGDVKNAVNNLNSTTDEYTLRQRDIRENNERLAESQNKVSLLLTGTTSKFTAFTTSIKATFYEALAGVVSFFSFFNENTKILSTRVKELANDVIDGINSVLPKSLSLGKFDIDVSSIELKKQLAIKQSDEFRRLEKEKSVEAAKEQKKLIDGTAKYVEQSTKKMAEVLEKGSIAQLKEAISDIEKKLEKTANRELKIKLSTELSNLKEQLADVEGEVIKIQREIDDKGISVVVRLDTIPVDEVEKKEDPVNKLSKIAETPFPNFGADDIITATEEAEARLKQYGATANDVANTFDNLSESIGKSTAAGRAFSVVSRVAAAANQVAAIAAGVLAITKAAAQPFPANIPAMISTVATITSSILALRNVVKPFAGGGAVAPHRNLNGYLRSNLVNVPVQPSGDNVYAVLKPNEIVLNESQQMRVRKMVGYDVFDHIQLPNYYANGGKVGLSPVTNTGQLLAQKIEISGGITSAKVLIEQNERLIAVNESIYERLAQPTRAYVAHQQVIDAIDEEANLQANMRLS